MGKKAQSELAEVFWGRGNLLDEDISEGLKVS